MFKLIKLEWRKNNILKYIRNAFILAVVLCIFIFAMAFLGIANDPDGTLDAAEGKNIISSPIELFTSISFLVFTGVMYASFIVSAYKNKTMALMFTYPVKRQKILISQMAAVWVFNFTALVLTKLFIYICIYAGSKNMQQSFVIDFNMADPYFYIQLLAKSFVTISMGFIALFAGLMLKSSKAAVVASFLLVIFTEANIGDFSLAGNSLFLVILTVLSFIFAGLSVCNAETRDLI